ncbi:MAG: hypothetical protein DIU74_002045 [Pseudomonadota bacterium]|mgnify:CR=1 FL=1
MKRRLALLALCAAFVLAGCATVAGTAVGAGIGAAAGDTRTGALIGGGVGLMIDIFD